MPVPIALQKRGRKPTKYARGSMAEIKGLAADQSLTSVRLHSVPSSLLRMVRLCLRRLGIKRKCGRKGAVRKPEECRTKLQHATAEDNTRQCRI